GSGRLLSWLGLLRSLRRPAVAQSRKRYAKVEPDGVYLAQSTSGEAMAKESFELRVFARGGSRGNGQGHWCAAKELAQEARGRPPRLPPRPPDRHRPRLRPHPDPGPAAAPDRARLELPAGRPRLRQPLPAERHPAEQGNKDRLGHQIQEPVTR